MKRYIVIMIFLILMSPYALAQEASRQSMRLQTLDNYIVNVDVNEDDTARITQSFDIVNRYREPVIPGRAKFVLFGSLEPEDVMISIGGSQMSVPDEDIVLEDGNKVVYYEIWRPIETGERLNVEVDFRTDVEPQGVLFKQLNLNFGEPDIPIDQMALSVTVPSGRRVTYSNLPITGSDGNTADIEVPRELIDVYQDESIVVEFSALPLPTLPFNGYWLWLLLIVMSAMILALKIISRRNLDPDAV